MTRPAGPVTCEFCGKVRNDRYWCCYNAMYDICPVEAAAPPPGTTDRAVELLRELVKHWDTSDAQARNSVTTTWGGIHRQEKRGHELKARARAFLAEIDTEKEA